MQINLKQPEIERALKMFIASQGISLQGRDIDISFTAGRRGSGVSAELQISEDPAAEIYEAPAGPINRHSVLSSVTVAEDVADSPDTNEEEETQEDEAPSTTASSLFGT